MIAFIKRQSSAGQIGAFTVVPILVFLLAWHGSESLLDPERVLGILCLVLVILACPVCFLWSFLLSIFWSGKTGVKALLIVISMMLLLASLGPLWGLIALAMIGPINPG